MKKFLIAAGLGILVLLLGLVGLAFYNPTNPNNYSDLLVLQDEVTEGEDGFPLIEQAANALSPSDLADWWNISQEIETNSTKASKLLEDNAEALQWFKQSLVRPRIRIPGSSANNIFSSSFYQSLPDNSWFMLTQLSILNSRETFRSGSEIAAFESLLSLIEHGHKIQDAGGSLEDWSSGIYVKRCALTEWTNLIHKSSIGCENLNQFSSRLHFLEPNLTGFSNAAKRDFQLTRELIADLKAGKQFRDFDLPHGIVLLTRPPHLSRLINTVETEEQFAMAMRASLASVTEPFSKMSIHQVLKRPESELKLSIDLLKGNAPGKILTLFTLPDYKDYLSDSCKEKTGDLPATLESLIPDFLPSIPIDPFDGRPIRYSREKKLIYSVGEDLIDSGGKIGVDHERFDLVFPINF